MRTLPGFVVKSDWRISAGDRDPSFKAEAVGLSPADVVRLSERLLDALGGHSEFLTADDKSTALGEPFAIAGQLSVGVPLTARSAVGETAGAVPVTDFRELLVEDTGGEFLE